MSSRLYGMARWSALIALLGVIWASSQAVAQGRELSTADRVAMLYAPQLNFTRRGDPLIRLGILEGKDEVQFTPSEPIRVLPQGPGGPEIDLPGGVTYTVAMSQGQPGRYKHWVVVDRVAVDQRAGVDEVLGQWEGRGMLPRTFEVGGLFAVRGKVFDSRVILVCVGGADTFDEAQTLRRRLEAEFGINGSVHSERLEFPGGTLTLTGRGMDMRIRHDDVLWVSSRRGREEAIAYTVPGIQKSYNGGEETRRYTGELIFASDKNGQIAVINNLGAERVLKGTVPSEIYASAPQGALRAQAIAARNEIFAAIGVRNLADPYMLRADVYDQVYGGLDNEDPRTNEAVDATRGEVMLAGSRIVNAVYSSNAAGFTENNENVWDAEPWPHLRGRPDAPLDQVPELFRDGITEENIEAFLASDFPAYSKVAPVSSARLYRWEREVEASKPQSWLAERGQDIGRIRHAEVISRGVSGRVIRLRLTGERGQAVVERELNVRRLFGGLRSGLFVMELEKGRDGFVRTFGFRGGGFGHGVGMCQTGAIGMASQGKTHHDILTHYYRGISVTRLY
ncbi:hypothetical protein DL240_11525 [Lujinxingia litoralis]|uniref:Sporulation stage II protein D amidase enhancer LytB N-terminal domain-containing protein n=1 Tax=Lujinxingia litoralis TaxID=2211119 RepID=A0A328C7C6_9DELT|nr:SpoIID/LytB domain-containing protein [Lujinxingia litoralis]RAL22468.1 hypothetical protein DL240_11525 [Lujinxingia litoralis]